MTMGRHQLREQLFRLLFRVEFNTAEEMAEQIALFFTDEEAPAGEADIAYITGRCQEILKVIPAIDAALEEKSVGWKLDRMGRVELTILRLAVYEILYDDAIPAGVAINEAVELAKVYGQESAGGFVNAILAKFVKE